MKSRFTFFLLLTATILFLQFSSNPPNARTGAPGDMGDCTACHTVPNGAFNGSIDIGGLPNTVVANQTYTITVTVNNPNMLATRGGFQIVAIDEDDANTGTLTNAGSNSTITSANNRFYHEHNPAQNFNAGVISWTVDWIAPSPTELMDGDSIFFYGAGLIGNGSGTGGDIVRLNQRRIEFEAPPVIPLQVSISNPVDPTCHDSDDGAALATAIDGTPTYSYMWDNGETDAQAINLSDGLHTVTVSDMGGMSATASVILNAPDEIEFVNPAATSPLCFGDNSGTISFDATGGTPGYSISGVGPNGYSFNSNTAPVAITELEAGAYDFTIADVNGCSKSMNFDLIAPIIIVDNLVQVIDVECFGTATGAILIDPLGGTGELSYSWSTGSTEEDLQSVVAGGYFLTITDDNLCSRVFQYSIDQPVEELSVSISESEAIPCNGLFGSLLAESNEENLQYLWSNDSSQEENAGIPAGTYSVTVTNAGLCTATASYTISEPEALDLSFSVTEIENGGDGAIAPLVSGGTPGYNFSWSNMSSDSLQSNLDAGVYTLTVTDANGCTIVDSVELSSIPCLISLSLDSLQNVSCFGQADGLLELAVQSNESYEILWSNGDTTALTNDLAVGSYSVTVTGISGCSVDSTFTITEPDSLWIMVDITETSNETSEDGTITVTTVGGTSPFEYQWSTQDSTNMIDSLSNGFYFLTIVDANGCTFSDTIEMVSIGCDLTLAVIKMDETCALDSNGLASVIVTGAEGPYSILWSTNETTDSISNLSAGVYSVIVEDSIGCKDSINFNIFEGDTLSLTQFTQTNHTCTDSLGMIEVSIFSSDPIIDYSWSNGDTTSVADSLELGNVSLTVTNSAGCFAIFDFEIIKEAEGDILVDIDTIPAYLDEEGIFYGLLNVENYINILQGSCEDSLYLVYDTATYLCNDIYFDILNVSLYNNGDSIQNIEVVVEVLDTIAPTVNCVTTTGEVALFCDGEASSFLVSLNLSDEDISDNCQAFYPVNPVDLVFDVTETGTYSDSYFVTDSSGNVVECIVTLDAEVNDPITITTTTIDATCFGGEDGCIEIEISGGTPPYAISPENLCNVPAGTYQIEIVDAVGCSILTNASINEPDEIVITIDSKGDETPGESDGFIDVSIVGGTPPYTYNWTENNVTVSNLEDLINFPASQYELEVTDSLGCVVTISSFIDIESATKDTRFDNIKVFPNPFNDQLLISGANNLEINCTVYNIFGEKLAVSSSRNPEALELNTSQLNPGIFIIKVQIENSYKTYKLIKQ